MADPVASGIPAEGLTAETILRAIGDQMVRGIERLHKRAFAPSRYEVRLHGSDYDHLKGILGAIEEEARELLGEQLERFNRGSIPDWVPFQKRRLVYEPAEGDWFFRFLEDPDDDLEPGQVRIVSELAAPQKRDPGGGTRTVLVSTRDASGATRSERVTTDAAEPGGGATTHAGHTVHDPGEAPTLAPALATLTYGDDHGVQRYSMRQSMIVIGRANDEAWTDVRLYTLADVSRQHARIRWNADDQRFEILDTSSYGTKVDGTLVPTSREVPGTDEREPWIPLPDRARIELAGVIELDFARRQPAPTTP